MSSHDAKGECESIFPFSGFSQGRPLSLEIDRNAFRHNLNQVKQIASNSSVMVVLKANAYGHGLVEMARLAGENDLAVAIPEEMRSLRHASIANRVWVLEGPFGSSCIDSNNNVVWVVHSLWQLELFVNSNSDDQYSICLKLDTGMNRLGLNSAEFKVAADLIRKSEGLNLHACMTHFSASDLPNGDQVNLQLTIFDECLSKLESSDVLKSTANSGGVLYYPNSHKDVVRPGIVLYGAMPCPSSEPDARFKPVMRFKSAVMALRTVKKGHGVGYGSRWIAERDSCIATIACGYGDGYPRHAQDGTPVAVFDSKLQSYVRVPLVGRVSMDMITIDVTDLSSCEPGAPVELWGERVKIDEVALTSDTIAYELMCGVTTRVPRVLVG